jgi:putative transcriptional regulator
LKEISIANNIANLRKAKGITQQQLAQSVNVSVQAVSKWENGISIPDTLVLVRIADFFNVSVDYLLCGTKIVCDDIYEAIFDKVMENKPQMAKES